MSQFVSGLDLGQTSDPTALAVLERRLVEKAQHYNVVHLERFQLGTSYPAIVDRVAGMFDAPPLKGSILAVDQTGVGRAVVDLFRVRRGRGYTLRPITITGGHKASREENGDFHVPKKDLAGVLQVVLQSSRIKIARSLPHADLLVKELANFRVKITAAANEIFEAWREGDNDDLVLALGMAAWMAERGCCGVWEYKPDPRAMTEYAKAPRGCWDIGPTRGQEMDDNDPRRLEG